MSGGAEATKQQKEVKKVLEKYPVWSWWKVCQKAFGKESKLWQEALGKQQENK